MAAKSKSIRAFVLDRTTGSPIQGAVVSASAVLRDDATRALGFLRSDHAGYVSFDISELHPPPNDLIEIDLTVVGDDASRKEIWPLIRPEGADLRPLFLTTSIVPTLSPELSRLPSIQNPDVFDWKNSPGSFSQSGAVMIGEDGCETLLPSTASIRTFRFNQIIREPAEQPQMTVQIVPASCESHALPNPGETSQGEFYVPLCYRLGALLEYESKWQPRGHALGELLYSLPLAPCETVRIAIIDWSRQDTAARGESASFDEQLINMQRRDRAIEETIDATLREWQRGSSFMGGLALSGSIGVISGALGIGGGSSSSSGTRKVAADTVQKIADTIAQSSSATRRLQSTLVVQASQAESEQLQTRSVTNNNHCHALTVLYYEVVRHFLVSVDIAHDADGSAAKRDVILVRQPPQEFLTRNSVGGVDLSNFNKYEQILEQQLLDNSLRPCFDVVKKLRCLAADFADQRLRTPAEEMEIGLLDFSVTVADNKGDSSSFFTLELRTTLGDWLPLVRDASDPRLVQSIPPRETLPAWIGGIRSADPSGGEFYPFATARRRSTFTVVPIERMKRRDITAMRITYHQLSAADGRDIEVTNFDLKVRDAAHPWTIMSGLPPTGGHFRHEVDTDFAIERPVMFEDVRSVEDLLSPDERCCLTKLRAHLNANLPHYYRAIRLFEDPDDRAVRFDRHHVTIGDRTRRLIDFIENRPVAVLGDYTAYPLLIEKEPGDTKPTFAEQLEVPEKPVEQIVSLPTRGVFAEAKLGHCNSCEKIDTTRFWDWAESPCPCNAPAISPIAAGSRARDTQLDPQSLPASLLRVAEPLDEPDPTGLKAVLDLLGRPEIFRDMSMSEQVAGLLGKLVESAAAIQKAKIESLAPRSSAGASGTGAAGSAPPAPAPAPTAASQQPAATSTAPAQQAAPRGSQARPRAQQERLDAINRAQHDGLPSEDANEARRLVVNDIPDGEVSKPPAAFDSYEIVLDRLAAAPIEDTHPIFFGRIALNYSARYPGIPPWAGRIPLYSFEIHGEGELHAAIVPDHLGVHGVLNTIRMVSLPDDLEGVEAVIHGISVGAGSAFTLTVPSLGTGSIALTGRTDIGALITGAAGVRGTFSRVRKIGVYTSFP